MQKRFQLIFFIIIILNTLTIFISLLFVFIKGLMSILVLSAFLIFQLIFLFIYRKREISKLRIYYNDINRDNLKNYFLSENQEDISNKMIKIKEKEPIKLNISENSEIIFTSEEFRNIILNQIFSENKIKTLYDISKLLIEIEDLNTLLDNILKKIAEFFGAKSGSIILWDNKREELIINNVFNIDKKFIGNTISIGSGIAGYVALTGEPIIIRKDTKSTKFNIDRKDIKDSIIFPIFFHKDLIGIINLNDTPLVGIMKDEEIISLMNSFANQTAIVILNNNLINKLKTIYKSTIKTLVNAIDAKDPYTAGHSERVTYYSIEIGKKINLDNESLDRLEFAAILHDVGKIGIPEEILSKPSKLDKDEFEIIKNHPKLSYKIVKPIELPWDISDDVLSHHERWDGGGYPNGKKEEKISIFSRIITIADAFDAMTSDRPYRRGLNINEAIDEISRNIGSQFDPNLAIIFINMIRNHEIKFN